MNEYENYFQNEIENSPEFCSLDKRDQDLIRHFLENIPTPFLHIRRIGDSLSDGLFICNKDGVILYVNKMNEKLTGINASECIGKNISQFINDGGMANVIVPQIIETESPYSSIAISPRTNIQMLETGSPLYNDEHELAGVVITDRDLSEMISLSERLKQSESKIAQYKEINHQASLVMNRLTEQHIKEQMNFSSDVQPESSCMKETYRLASLAAMTDVTILLTGETGVGKEVIANYIYNNSPRRQKPFIKVNCAAIPANLLESELFGYVKGAFTGADSRGKPGLFELANTGTLYLDEVGELPLDFQAKLLRALQQHEITRVGDTKTIRLDLRIIAATNRDLKSMVDKKLFRSDLYYRLNIFPIEIPALRERQEDIVPMIHHFLNLFNQRYNKNIVLDADCIGRMKTYTWPGNIRELENVIERWVVIFGEFETLTWDKISGYFSNEFSPDFSSQFSGKSLKEILRETEYQTFQWALATFRTSRDIAKALHIDHSTVVRKIKALGLSLTKRK